MDTADRTVYARNAPCASQRRRRGAVATPQRRLNDSEAVLQRRSVRCGTKAASTAPDSKQICTHASAEHFLLTALLYGVLKKLSLTDKRLRLRGTVYCNEYRRSCALFSS